MNSSTEKSFTYSSSKYGLNIEHPVTIPLPRGITINELAYHISNIHNIPPNLYNDIVKQLDLFVDEETENYELEPFITSQNLFLKDFQARSDHLLAFDKLTWNKNRLRDSDRSLDEDSQFHEKYHNLLQSGFLVEPIVLLEHTYRVPIMDLLSRKQSEMTSVCDEQTVEMEKLGKLIDKGATDEDMNRLAMKYFRKCEAVRNKWDQSIEDLQKTQKKEFREWISRIYDDYNNHVSKEYLLQKISDRSNFLSNGEQIKMDAQESPQEESFTINLGSQLKSTHNLRLRASNALDLCDTLSISNPDPLRLQTAMSLYSNSLSALVLMVDNRINAYTGIKKEFAARCLQSTDFHFPNIEEQFNTIKLKANKLLSSSKLPKETPTLRSGDFYITHHSNMSQIHVVFHLVTEESVYSNDVSSRHPVILGLRNIFKVAHWHDINTISLPLFLIHELSEDITIQWCLKRAELILKCVKGFMIEMASFPSSRYENKTIQFLVPKGISADLFVNLASMLSGIFRLSSPLVVKTKASSPKSNK
ncbi:FERRY endosomal RAB5 effector complex subunit 3 isoform X2 [Brevipalpus obovatus]|uniref:FERRY endosomal RAB5 effector complex subunit 3 isoform X2 n=1 Tax=Brevipalpus obovatus TaxID=246614 RepID=UPI003D9DB3AF